MRITVERKGRRHRVRLLPGRAGKGKEAVSGVNIVDLKMRIGRAVVRMGGIAGVHTAAKHRKKGYARRVMEYSIQYMRNQRFDISILFGIRGFYTKFGYATCLAHHKSIIATRVAEEVRKKYKTRPMTKSDIPAILKIYEENNRERTGAVLRPPRYWKGFPKGTRWGEPPLALVVLDRRGQIIGYAAYDETQTQVSVVELGAKTDGIYSTLLKQFANIAIKLRTAEINFFLPEDHPFAHFLQRYDCRREATYRKDGGGMGRIVNQDALFQKIQGELERRLAISPWAEYRGALEIKTDLGITLILLNQGKVVLGEETAKVKNRLQLPQWALAQLVLGYRDVRTLLGVPGVKAIGQAPELAEALFPRGVPYMWLPDHF